MLKTAELKKALTTLKKTYNRKSTLPVLGCVHVMNDGKSSFWSTTNFRDLGTIRLPACSDTIFEAVIDLVALEKALPAMGKEVDITLDMVEPYQNIKVTGINGTTWNMKAEDKDSFPPVLNYSDGTLFGALTGQELLAALKATRSAVSDDPVRPVLQQILVRVGGDGSATFIGCDGFRMAIAGPYRMQGFTFGTQYEFYISPAVADFLLKTVQPEDNIFFSEDWAHKVVAVTPGVGRNWHVRWEQESGHYPDVNAIIPKAQNRARMAEIRTVADTIHQSISGMRHMIAFTFNEDGTIAINNDYNGVKASAVMTAECVGNWRDFGVNPDFLRTALASSGNLSHRIRLMQERPDSVMLLTFESQPLEWVIMPMHI